MARTKEWRSLWASAVGAHACPDRHLPLGGQPLASSTSVYPNLSLLFPHHPGGLPRVMPMTGKGVEVGWE